MNTLGILGSIIAAITGIVTVLFSWSTWHDSKRNILKRIDKKERKIAEFERRLCNIYGAAYSKNGPIHPLEAKKQKLQSEVDSLKKLL